jgi:hypothetical protein
MCPPRDTAHGGQLPRYLGGLGRHHNWYLPDQYIEVSGVPDGSYVLETIADPRSTLAESDESNNVQETLIRICGERVDQVEPGAAGC